MGYWGRAGLASLFVFVVLSGVSPALAHRFGVALVLPLSGEGAATSRSYVDGFMLATTERDAHANEQSDGHLGGLDVYVRLVDSGGDLQNEIEAILAQRETEIVALWGAEEVQSLLEDVLAGQNAALLVPGETVDLQAGLPGVARFVSAFEARYGTVPSSEAVQGYNAARRIDLAVRSAGSASDLGALAQSFSLSAAGIDW